MTDPLLVVTGSSGFIGAKTVSRFAPAARVVGLDVKPPPELPARVEFVRCDLTKDDDVVRAFDLIQRAHGDRIACVIHLAAHDDFSGAPSPLYRGLTVEGTRRLLRALRAFAVEQVVFASTLLVMKAAGPDDGAITESSPVEANWDYPASKLEAEEVLRAERGPIPVLVLRLAAVYDDACHCLPLAQHIRRIREKSYESYLFPGDARRGQPFVHVDDVVSCFREAFARRAELPPEETLLVAEPDVMTYAELQEQLGTLIHGRDWPTVHLPAPVAKAFLKPWMIDQGDAHYPVSPERVRRRLGWEPKRRLRDTLPLMIGRLFRDARVWYAANHLPWPERESAGGPVRAGGT